MKVMKDSKGMQTDVQRERCCTSIKTMSRNHSVVRRRGFVYLNKNQFVVWFAEKERMKEKDALRKWADMKKSRLDRQSL